MGKETYKQLLLEDRCMIFVLQQEEQSIRKIASTLARLASTISREIKRNVCKTKGYQPSYAQIQTTERRWRDSRLEHQPTLRDAVMDLLAMGWVTSANFRQVGADTRRLKFIEMFWMDARNTGIIFRREN